MDFAGGGGGGFGLFCDESEEKLNWLGREAIDLGRGLATGAPGGGGGRLRSRAARSAPE